MGDDQEGCYYEPMQSNVLIVQLPLHNGDLGNGERYPHHHQQQHQVEDVVVDLCLAEDFPGTLLGNSYRSGSQFLRLLDSCVEELLVWKSSFLFGGPLGHLWAGRQTRSQTSSLCAPAVRVASFVVQTGSVLLYAAEEWAPDVMCAVLGYSPRRRGWFHY